MQKQKVHGMTKQVRTPEQKARINELQRERRANLTPEQKARESELRNQPEKKARKAELDRERRANRTPEQVSADKAREKEYKKDYYSDPINKERMKLLMAESDHLRKYGVGLQETKYKYGTICNCCGTDCKSTQPLVTDHCHDTDDIRGRICSEYNLGIGLCGDTVEGLERAIKYLRGNHG